MIESFFQNMNVGMTKETYYEMCEALGSEPVEEELPVEMDDFPPEVQEAISIYYRLRDEWDTMNGIYIGKSFAGLADILDILEVDQSDRKYLLEWISIMDTTRAKVYKDSKPSKENKSAKSPV